MAATTAARADDGAPSAPSASAKRIVEMKQALVEHVKAGRYEDALATCDELAALAPNDAIVAQYAQVLRQKIELDDDESDDDDDEEGDATSSSSSDDDASGDSSSEASDATS